MEKTAKPVTRTETAVVEQPTAPLAVERVIFDVPRGAKVFSNEGNSVIGMGTGCARKSFDEEWEGGREFSEEPELIAEVETALAAAKLDVVSSGAYDLFQSSDTSRAAYRLGAVVKDMHFSLCGGTNALNTEWDGRVIAEGSVTVEWQLFSQLRQEVVYVGQTTGAAASGQDSEDGVLLAILNGVGNAAAELTHDEKFIAELQMASAGGAGASAGQGTAEPLVISGPSRLSGSFSSNAERAQAATVLIVGSGHGSGVLISSDGYLLTNYHVVGEANEVRVELDGAGVLIGQVLRRDPYRDVALIKVPVNGATALPLNTSTPGVGSEIYAIGAPLDTALTDTVTKGIVSSIRDLDGQRFIQGDLDIQPGNSGGPLTDPSGNVIGLTVSGIMTDGTSVGINFFIPIAEALTALNLTVN